MTKSSAHPYLATLTVVASLFGVGLLTCGTASAQAQGARPSPPNFLALGIAFVPEFEGSADRSAVPALIGRVAIGSTTLRLLGNRAQWSFLPASSPWAVGPVLSLRSSRDEDTEDAVVKRLRAIDASAGAGVFAEYQWPGLVKPDDSLTAGLELLGGKAGAHAQASLGYQWQAAPGVRLNTSGHVGLASGKYQQTYFDVDADNAVRSGLPRFSGKRGTYEVGVALGASYEVSKDWLLIGRLQVMRLTGDAADSPIVTLRGDRSQGSFALALGRAF